jgi:hypothetical protein
LLFEDGPDARSPGRPIVVVHAVNDENAQRPGLRDDAGK